MKRLLFLLPLLLVLCPSSTKASIALTANVCNVSTAAVTSTNCPLNAANLTSGSLLVCGMMWGNVVSGTTYSITDPTNGTYTVVSSTPINDGLGSNSLYMAWIKNTSTAASLTVTFNATGNGNHTIRAACYEYTSTIGWPTNPVDTQSGQNSSVQGVSGNAPNVTPSATGELIFAAIILASGATANSFTVSGTGFTRQDAGGTAGSGWGSNTRAVGCDNQNSGNAATTCTFSWATNNQWAAAQVVFKPGAAAGPTCSNSIALMGAGCR